MIKEYYSNCLIEALLFKLRHYKEVDFCHVSVSENYKKYKVRCPHFYCRDRNFPKLTFHFFTKRRLRFPQWLWWKGWFVFQTTKM